MIKMVKDKAYWKAEMDAWDGLNKYLYKKARKAHMRCSDGPVEEVKTVKKEKLLLTPELVVPIKKLSAKEYKRKSMKELRVIAKGLGLKVSWRIKEDRLIEEIIKVH